MSHGDVSPPRQGLVTLSGAISKYRCTRGSASFVLTQSDRSQMGIVAVAAGVAGLSGPAISTASAAGDTHEDADYVEFEVEGQAVKGWVWRSPFKEGDVVEVAAEPRSDHYEAVGIARPRDRIIALYPHCSRGPARHIQNAARWWAIGMVGFGVALCLSMFTGVDESRYRSIGVVCAYTWLGVGAFFGLMTVNLARKWMPYANTAEKVFTALRLPNPSRIDLVRISRAQRTSADPDEFGTFYFRY